MVYKNELGEFPLVITLRCCQQFLGMSFKALFFYFILIICADTYIKTYLSCIYYIWRSVVRYYRCTQQIFQCQINVVSKLWINVEITLIRSWKWNKIRCRIFNVAQRWCNIVDQRWSNVTQLSYNLILKWPQRHFEVNRASLKYRFKNRLLL